MRTFRSMPLVALLALAPFAAFADGEGEPKEAHATPAPAPRAEERGACTGSGQVAQVASVSGDVHAVAPDGSMRALGCDDAVNACDTIATGDGASAGLLVGDSFVQLGANTRAQLAVHSPPELALETGAARVIDSRDQASDRVQLWTPQLAASTGRGDAEITRAGDDVRVCAYTEPLTVRARDGAQTLPAGRCLGTRLAGGAASVAAGEPAVALGDGASCPFHVSGAPGLLPPVSAPPTSEFPPVAPFGPPGRDSCDDPGSGCGGAPVCTICDDPDPGTDCGFPGSPCNGDD